MRLAVGMPPANDTFFQVAIMTCLGSNLVVPTIPSLVGKVSVNSDHNTNTTPTQHQHNTNTITFFF